MWKYELNEKENQYVLRIYFFLIENLLKKVSRKYFEDLFLQKGKARDIPVKIPSITLDSTSPLETKILNKEK